jgi:hypothetical protein
MSEMEMKNDVDTEEFTEEFTDELSDEALDREGGGKVCCGPHHSSCLPPFAPS